MKNDIPKAKAEAAEEISEQVREFLERGGEIQEVPDGVLGDSLVVTYDSRKQVRLKKKNGKGRAK